MSTFERLVAEAAGPLATALSALLAALILFVLARRARTNLKSLRNQQTSGLCQELIAGLMTGAIQYPDVIAQLRKCPAAQVRPSVATVLTADKNLPAGRAAP
jgi:hypothetical protein